jgi:hypothetical protein
MLEESARQVANYRVRLAFISSLIACDLYLHLMCRLPRVQH